MKVKVLSIVIGFFVAGVAAVPVSAHEGHGSCQAFGEGQSTIAQEERPFGQLASSAAQGGFMAALIEETHTTEGLCESR